MESSPLKASSRFLALAFSGWGLKWKGLIDNRQGEWWLIAQILLISANLLPGWPLLYASKSIFLDLLSIIGIFFFLIGITLIVKAFLSLGASLSPLPEPKLGACLVTEGSYKYCRHPLYQGLLISTFGWSIFLGSILHLALFIGLCILLIGKAKREEDRLKRKYFEYNRYSNKTPAIIKGIPFFDW